MKHVASIALLQFRLVLRAKATLLLMLALPLMLTLVFGVLMNGESDSSDPVYPIAVVNMDSSPEADRLVRVLQEEAALDAEITEGEALKKLFADRQIVTAVVIPAGYGSTLRSGTAPEVEFTLPPNAGANAFTVRAILRRLVTRAALNRSGAEVPIERQAVTKAAAEAGSGLAPVNFSAVGFTVMFIMMMVSQLSGVILAERQAGTWGRLLTTPASRASILVGYLVSFVAVGFLQFGVLVGVSSLLFQLSWGPILPLLAVALALIICSSGIGLFLAGLVRTAEQQSTLGTLVVVATSMLGGVFWPLELVGGTVRKIGLLTPQAWAMDGFREVMLRDGAWSGLWLPLAVLLGMGCLFLIIGLKRVRFE